MVAVVVIMKRTLTILTAVSLTRVLQANTVRQQRDLETIAKLEKSALAVKRASEFSLLDNVHQHFPQLVGPRVPNYGDLFNVQLEDLCSELESDNPLKLVPLEGAPFEIVRDETPSTTLPAPSHGTLRGHLNAE